MFTGVEDEAKSDAETTTVTLAVAQPKQLPKVTCMNPLDPQLEHHLSYWSSVDAPELAVLLVRLKVLSEVHKSHHWIAQGDSFYGDHLLFERLYDTVVEEIDVLAERAVMIGGTPNVNRGMIAHQVADCLEIDMMSIPSPNALALRSLESEQAFFRTLNSVSGLLEGRGCMTRGVRNMLEGMADSNEKRIYLLKQRANVPMSGGSM